jgi:hypothetical protein
VPPRQNRVTPFSEIISDSSRGLLWGNRGNLHDAHGAIRRRPGTPHWIACRLRYKDWHRAELMQPGRMTELFFLDEATAFSAGHRPCALCRREDYKRFLALAGARGADELDGRLQGERLDGRAQRHHAGRFADLPRGAFVVRSGEPWLVLDDALRRWTPGGYTDSVARPTGDAVVITPPTTVEVLRAGWEDAAVPFVHPSAR